VQEQRTRKGTQPFFIGARGSSRDAEEEEEEREDPRAARARAQAEKRAAQERAKQEAAQARSAEQVRVDTRSTAKVCQGVGAEGGGMGCATSGTAGTMTRRSVEPSSGTC
jgi:hypothetical protein